MEHVWWDRSCNYYQCIQVQLLVVCFILRKMLKLKYNFSYSIIKTLNYYA